MTSGYYESERAVAEYLLFHYGTLEQTLAFPAGPKEGYDYPARCVREGLAGITLPEKARALDVGCSVGRASFELARNCAEVIGVDLSQRFIDAAKEMQGQGWIEFDRADEGMRTTRCRVEVPPEIDRGRVTFETGDALDLPARLGVFDVVLAANLVDRLPRPAVFLERCQTLVKPGGHLLLASPYTWLEEYTSRDHWLGGQPGSTTDTGEVIAAKLQPEFTLLKRADLPFLLREHARKYQWSVAELLVFTRRQ